MSGRIETPDDFSNSLLPLACAVGDGIDDPLSRRQNPEQPDPYRTPFQRDRGRIIHARAFRRLAGKTQVFTRRYSDHFRSRLTHTLEVAQIARSIAYALGLNQDLTEALALVHDIGHPPFGHAGERALDQAMREFGLGFDHNLHALRIVEHFEIRYAAYRGLNLTLGMREGIVKHSRDYTLESHPELEAYFLDRRPPLEAQLIDLADEIAYISADMEDGFEAGILSLDGLCANVRIFSQKFRAMQAQFPYATEQLLFNEALKRVLNTLVVDLVQETARRVKSAGIVSVEGVRDFPARLAAFSPEIEALRREAKQYLYTALYSSDDLKSHLHEAATVVQDLFTSWVADPTLLPSAYQGQIASEGVPRVVADYIAGMTDNYILQQYEQWRREVPLSQTRPKRDHASS